MLASIIMMILNILDWSTKERFATILILAKDESVRSNKGHP